MNMLKNYNIGKLKYNTEKYKKEIIQNKNI